MQSVLVQGELFFLIKYKVPVDWYPSLHLGVVAVEYERTQELFTVRKMKNETHDILKEMKLEIAAWKRELKDKCQGTSGL